MSYKLFCSIKSHDGKRHKSPHLGWFLQTQTNALPVGLGTNWVRVPDSELTNQISITIDPGIPSAFFRLAYP